MNRKIVSFMAATVIKPGYVSVTATTLATLTLPRVLEPESGYCQCHSSDTDNTGLDASVRVTVSRKITVTAAKHVSVLKVLDL